MANVDPGELAKFASRAAEWWDPRGAFRTLHEINELRLDYIDGARAACRSASARRRLRRRPARRGAWPRAAQASSQSTWRPRTSASPADHAVGALRIDYRCVDVEADRGRDGRPVRRRHLPRDARARARSRRDRAPPAPPPVRPGGARILLDDQSQPKGFAFAIVGAEYVLGCCRAARTSTRSSFGPPSSRAGAERPASKSRSSPACTTILPRAPIGSTATSTSTISPAPFAWNG